MQQIQGAITALVTPMRDGRVDEQGLVDLIEFQIASGIHGLVPCGTTGESATLNFDEHKRVIELTVQTVKGRVPVIAGTGANSTAEAIELTQSAKQSGADAVLSVVPYYNKPSQEGLYQHFRAILDAVDIPMVLYNVPGRTVTNMLPTTVARLATLTNVVGIKEACGSLNQVSELVQRCPKDFIILSAGEDGPNDGGSAGGRSGPRQCLALRIVLPHGGHVLLSQPGTGETGAPTDGADRLGRGAVANDPDG